VRAWRRAGEAVAHSRSPRRRVRPASLPKPIPQGLLRATQQEHSQEPPLPEQETQPSPDPSRGLEAERVPLGPLVRHQTLRGPGTEMQRAPWAHPLHQRCPLPLPGGLQSLPPALCRPAPSACPRDPGASDVSSKSGRRSADCAGALLALAWAPPRLATRAGLAPCLRPATPAPAVEA